MESLRLVNIRSFADSGAINISPLTLLVGQNSSGKSTFARFFPLLRQTSEVLTREPLLWLGRLVDFGSAEESVSKFAADQDFGADFEFRVAKGMLARPRRSIIYTSQSAQYKEPIRVCASIRYRQSGTTFNLRFLQHQICFDFDDTQLSKLRINGTDYTNLFQGKIFASTWTSCFPNILYRSPQGEVGQLSDPFLKQIQAYARNHTHGKSQQDRIDRLTRALASAPLDDLLTAVKTPYAGDSTWQKTTHWWTETTASFTSLRDWIIGSRCTEILQSASTAFSHYSSRIRYITPIRASAERYYRRQGLALGEIDPQGQNVAMFLHSMAAVERQKFNKWTSDFFGCFIDTTSTQGHISMVLKSADVTSDGSSFNLADTGFGFSQMIPVIMQIWNLLGSRSASSPATGLPTVNIISIEQPELHLHPKLQSRLADLLIEAVSLAKQGGIDLRLVIETHSEQIINRVGKRVASGKLRREDASIILFDKPHFTGATTVTATKYDDEGLIDNWPYGFFESEDK